VDVSSVKRAAKRLLGGTRLWRFLCVARYHLVRQWGELRHRYCTSPLVRRVRDLAPGLVYRRLQTTDFYGGSYFDAPKDPWEYSGYGDHYVDVDDFRQLAVQVRELLEARTALDVGCAKGFLVRALRREGVEAWGADLSEYAVATAPEEVRPWLKVGRCQDLPFPDSAFDVLVLMETLEHIPPPELDRALAEVRRLAARWVLATIPALGLPAFGPEHAPRPDGSSPPFFQPVVDLTPFRSLERDHYGYPLHGHVTIASQDYWNALFSRFGFARRQAPERKVREAVDTMRKGDWIPFLFERASAAMEAGPLVQRWELDFRETEGVWSSEVLCLEAGRHFLHLELRLRALPPRQAPGQRCLHARAISLDGQTLYGVCLLDRRAAVRAAVRGRLTVALPLACPGRVELVVQLQGEPGLAFAPAPLAVFRSIGEGAAAPAATVLIPFPARVAVGAQGKVASAVDDQSFSRKKLAL